MAIKRQFYQGDCLSLDAGRVWLNGEATIGASGDSTLVTANGASKGFTSINDTDTGDYTITLDKRYNKLLSIQFWFEHSATTGIESWVVRADLSAGTIQVTFYDSAGTEVDPPSGSVMHCDLCLKAVSY